MADDRTIAERALDFYCSGAVIAEDCEWPPSAERIRAARERVGLTSADTAERLGITLPAYDDLERYNDEPFTAITLGTLCSLGLPPGVPPAQLLLGVERIRPEPCHLQASVRGPQRTPHWPIGLRR